MKTAGRDHRYIFTQKYYGIDIRFRVVCFNDSLFCFLSCCRSETRTLRILYINTLWCETNGTSTYGHWPTNGDSAIRYAQVWTAVTCNNDLTYCLFCRQMLCFAIIDFAWFRWTDEDLRVRQKRDRRRSPRLL